MIAPTAHGCKRAGGERVQIRERQIVRNPLYGQEIHRHGIVSENHNTAQFPPSDRPSGLRQGKPALARSFRFRIPQPPAPRDRRDRACSQDSLSQYWANESWSFFVWAAFGLIVFQRRDRSAAAAATIAHERLFQRNLVKRRVGRTEHRAGLVAIAALDIDHRGIDPLAGNIFERHAPAAGAAVPVTYLEQSAHHIVVG
jgi:hypothetical protein